MTSAATLRFQYLRRGLLAGGISFALIAAILSCFKPAEILPAYRLAVFICLAPALGSLLFALIHRCTGGRWGDALGPLLTTGSQLAPWIWLLVFPLLFFPFSAPTAWPEYESTAMIALRALVFGAALFMLAGRLAHPSSAKNAWLGPVGLIVLLLLLHLLSDDWLAALEPGWHSTAFPLVWAMGQAAAGLACAVLVGLLSGIDPRTTVDGECALGLDWGNLLLTAALFWCYLMFAQFLIIWGGNIPRETSWFIHHLRGSWSDVPILLVIFHFAVPLAILLSRRLKQSARALQCVAIILLAAQAVFLAWLILPAFAAGDGWSGALDLALPAAAVAVFLHRYLTIAERRMERP
jgi:hypothetical protein